MKKKLLSLLLIAAMVFAMTACGKSENSSDNTTPAASEASGTTAADENETNETTPSQTVDIVEGCDINIASLKGPTSIGLVKLFSDSDEGATINNYNYSIYGAADEISTGIVKGEIDVAAVPCNLAAVLYNKTEGQIVTAAVNTLGVLYILEKGENLNTLEDLKGKTIYTTGQGTTPEYTLRYLLSANGIDPDNDVDIQFLSEASEVVSTISTMETAIAMLPQPYVTVAQNTDESLYVAFDITEEWEKLDEDSTVVTGVLIARKDFIDEHPEQFAAFLEEYKASAEFANTEVEQTAELVEKFDIFKAAIAKKAIPACNITFISGQDMTAKVSSYLQVLYDADPSSVGGTLPDDGIFYIAE